MSLKTKLKVYFRNKFYKKLNTDQLHAYKAILRLLYHKQANTPLKDPKQPKYFLRVDCLDLDLVIDAEKAEIVNGSHIYPLQLEPIVLERAVFMIEKEVSRQRYELELSIKWRKNTILENIFKKIK